MINQEKIRFAFYKSEFKDGSIIDDIISRWTWLPNIGTPPYSHVEIGVYNNDKWIYFSSTTRNRNTGIKKSNGTRWEKESVLFKNKDRWDVYECISKEDTLPDAMDIVERANDCLNSKYDWLGIFGFITPFGLFNSRKKWYCSEVCYYVLTGIWKKRISPRRFYRYVNNMFNLKKAW